MAGERERNADVATDDDNKPAVSEEAVACNIGGVVECPDRSGDT